MSETKRTAKAMVHRMMIISLALSAYIFRMGRKEYKAFEQGLIDIPFAPSRYNAGKIFPARDNDGMIRILEFGNLAFTDDIKAFHRKKIKQRAKLEKRDISFQLTVDDVYSVSKGKLIGRPQV